MAGTDRTLPERSAVKLTYDDLLLWADDGRRHELIDGEHYVTLSPNLRHQRISGHLFTALRRHLEEHALGEVLYAPLDVLFSPHDVVEPDLLYVSRERAAAIFRPEHVRGAPDLVVEIASKGTRRRDETIKRMLYERSDVTEYWVVDPEIDVVRVYRRDAGAFARPAELRRDAGDTLTTPLLPGLAIPLDTIFAD